jgi:hypothetical protein
MKTIIDNHHSKHLPLLLFVFITVLFASCKKDKNNTAVILPAHISILDVNINTGVQDFYLDDSLINSSPLTFNSVSSYFAVRGGKRHVEFKNEVDLSVSAQFDISLAPGNYYTIFYMDGNSYTTAMDDRTAPQSGKNKIRFINVDPTSTANIEIGTGSGPALVSNLSDKTVSAFFNVSPGAGINIYKTGVSTPLINVIIPNTTGHTYTYAIYYTGTGIGYGLYKQD